jgi:hypothetical protein
MVDTLVTIINLSLITSSPLKWLQHCARTMLEKGKGNFIENLRFIQLCEADLNFVLHILWGNRLS